MESHLSCPDCMCPFTSLGLALPCFSMEASAYKPEEKSLLAPSASAGQLGLQRLVKILVGKHLEVSAGLCFLPTRPSRRGLSLGVRSSQAGIWGT